VALSELQSSPHLNVGICLKDRTGYGTFKTVALFCGYGTVNTEHTQFPCVFYAHKRPNPYLFRYISHKNAFKLMI